jgi:hypothetical protein
MHRQTINNLLVMLNLFSKMRNTRLQVARITYRNKGHKNEGKKDANRKSNISRSDFAAWNNHDVFTTGKGCSDTQLEDVQGRPQAFHSNGALRSLIQLAPPPIISTHATHANTALVALYNLPEALSRTDRCQGLFPYYWTETSFSPATNCWRTVGIACKTFVSHTRYMHHKSKRCRLSADAHLIVATAA